MKKGAKTYYKEFKVASRSVVEKVKVLIHQGNIRRIIIKDERGRTFLEIPLTVAAVGTLAAPLLAAVGAAAALVSQFTFVVEKVEPKKAKAKKSKAKTKAKKR